jgi:hypothetical protein
MWIKSFSELLPRSAKQIDDALITLEDAMMVQQSFLGDTHFSSLQKHQQQHNQHLTAPAQGSSDTNGPSNNTSRSQRPQVLQQPALRNASVQCSCPSATPATMALQEYHSPTWH